MEFKSLPLSPSLLQVVAELGFEKLTPIQAQSIPLLLKGKDVIGQSKTGSGKTAAFGLPILNQLEKRLGSELPRRRETRALILCPTRELCTQVARELRKLGRRVAGLQVLILSGGQPIFPQLQALEKGAHIAVGTPGRVLDHLTRGTLDLSNATTVVLDEADRMLDMGFQEDMERILRALPKTRQLALFSATFPRTIEAMSRNYQKEPVRVTIEEPEERTPDIRQIFYETAAETKLKGVLWLLRQHPSESAIIFCNFKASVTELARTLREGGLSAGELHGDLEQADRDRVMAKFRNQSTRILVATDVAARGIDVADLDLVINYELPAQPEVYVHRIGRTGRAGKRGLAISLGTSREKSKLERIESLTGSPLSRKTLAPLANAEIDTLSQGARNDARMETLYISGGRKDKLRPGDILGALTGEAGGLQGSDIGKIEIHDRFAYVAVAKSVARVALTRLRNGRIKGRKFRIEPVA
ncbi:MAG: ATP-dependent RNA helicase DbpA [Oligoflexia bacterium]|nr:ATP-dependent RNA helicase DbpA [Oligoflexia bacterium]